MPPAPQVHKEQHPSIWPRSSADWDSWSSEGRGGVLAVSILLFFFLFALAVWFFYHRRKKEQQQRRRRSRRRSHSREDTRRGHRRSRSRRRGSESERGRSREARDEDVPAPGADGTEDARGEASTKSHRRHTRRKHEDYRRKKGKGRSQERPSRHEIRFSSAPRSRSEGDSARKGKGKGEQKVCDPGEGPSRGPINESTTAVVGEGQDPEEQTPEDGTMGEEKKREARRHGGKHVKQSGKAKVKSAASGEARSLGSQGSGRKQAKRSLSLD